MSKLLSILITILSFALQAQQSNTMYFMYRLPQSSFLNPARQYPCQFNMGMPLLSSIQFNYGNTAFSAKSMSDVSGNTLTFNNNKILANTHNLDHISTEFHYTLLSFGFKKFEYYFSFSLTEKNEFYLSLPKDLTGFAIQGNGGYIGKEISFDRLGVNFFHYREYGFAASKQVNEDLQVGLRLKLLFGKANINTRKSDISIKTDANTFDPTISSNSIINMSAPVTIQTNASGAISSIDFDQSASVTNLIFNGKNPGLALDGGFIYQYDDRLSYSTSFNDLGFIWWRSYVNNVTQKGSYQYTGQIENATSASNVLLQLVDTVRASFAPTFTRNSYFTMLPFKMYSGAEYKLNNTFRAGLLGRLWYYQYRIHPSIILSANAKLTRFFTATLTYSYTNYTLRNLGFGLTMQTRNLQFYVLTDNFAGLIWWDSARNLNARFGINLFFGCKSNSRSSLKCTACYWYQQAEERRSSGTNKFSYRGPE